MSTVLTKLEDGVFEIALNRPETLNSLNHQLSIDLRAAVYEARTNDEVKAVIVYGNGKGFCAGGDLPNMGINKENPLEVKEFLGRLHESVLGLHDMEKPVIAAVHGAAVGAGCNLAFACDIIIAEETSVFSELFVGVGALPDLGSLFFLPQKVGMHKALELIYTGERMKAPTALEYGLINKVVPKGTALEAAREFAKPLAAGPVKALGLAKNLMHKATYMPLKDVLDLEASAQAVIFQTYDFKEGCKAFEEKRPAVFKGK